MSQIGNKIKAGFYATPDRQGDYIRSLLSFKEDTSIFDPTCGEGAVLSQIAQDQPDCMISTYGVELDKGRAARAAGVLHHTVQAPIESMIISHDVFGMIYLNPPYDHTMSGIDDEEKTERKEYTELVRNTKYLKSGGVMVYVIPSYRFADKKIARFLSSHFEDVALARFSDEDYDDFRQCIFIGRKKSSRMKELNPKLFEFLQQMRDESFIFSSVTQVQLFVGRKTWTVPGSTLSVPTFYTRIEDKKQFAPLIRENKGFQAFKERIKPKQLTIGGDPLINIQQGQMALLLAAGAVNGVLGEGDTLHAVQGMEKVSKVKTEQETEHSKTTKIKTRREISVKVICPDGQIKKFV